MASKNHRQAVLDALNQLDVSTETTPKELVALITSSQVKPRIAFTDEHLPPEGVNHNKPLHIIVKYQGNLIPAYIVNNGSTLNVYPLITAIQLGVDESNVGKSTPGFSAQRKKQVPFKIFMQNGSTSRLNYKQ